MSSDPPPPFTDALRQDLVHKRDVAQYALDAFDEEQGARLRAAGKTNKKRCPKMTIGGQCTRDAGHGPEICAGAGIGPWRYA